MLQASQQVAAAISSEDPQEVKQALRAAVMALSNNLSPSDNREVIPNSLMLFSGQDVPICHSTSGALVPNCHVLA